MQTGVKLSGNGQAPVQKYWKQLMAMIQEGEINPLDMVTHRMRLEDMEKIYAGFEKRDMQKIFVQTKHSAAPSPGSPALTTL